MTSDSAEKAGSKPEEDLLGDLGGDELSPEKRHEVAQRFKREAMLRNPRIEHMDVDFLPHDSFDFSALREGAYSRLKTRLATMSPEEFERLPVETQEVAISRGWYSRPVQPS